VKFGGPWNEKIGTLCGHLEYITAIWYILLPFGNLAFWYILLPFGNLAFWYILLPFLAFWYILLPFGNLAFWYILLPFGNLVGFWCIFPPCAILCREISGNPGQDDQIGRTFASWATLHLRSHVCVLYAF
jgi:hypothetical protein